MTNTRSATLALCLLAGACSAPEGPPLSISSVLVLAPLPGTYVTAGYVTLHNNSSRPITIKGVTSPQFAQVEMHETVIRDDVARMTSIEPLIVDAQSSVLFEPGGKHMMMSRWPTDIVPGMPVTLEFHYDTSGLLIVATTVRTRDDLAE